MSLRFGIGPTYCGKSCGPNNTVGVMRSTENSGGQGNPISPIDVNAFCTTNFRS